MYNKVNLLYLEQDGVVAILIQSNHCNIRYVWLSNILSSKIYHNMLTNFLVFRLIEIYVSFFCWFLWNSWSNETFVHVQYMYNVQDERGLSLAGFISWLIWRSAYLTRVVSWRNRFYVAVNWATTLVFGRDNSRIGWS